MISNVNKTVTDITKYVVSSLNENNMDINEFSVQKIIYQIKMDLNNKRSLYNQLPYYWYYYGPYSELVHDSFNNINFNENINHDEITLKYPEIINLVQDLLDKGNYVYHDLGRDIYKKYAPFDVLYPFKYKIFNVTQYDAFSCDGDEFVNAFRYCQPRFSLNHFHHDFSCVFSKLAMRIDMLNDNNLIEDCWDILRLPIRNLWFTFAESLRVKIHDEYYDNQSEKWNNIFLNSLKQSNQEIDNMINKTNPLIDFSIYGEYDDFDKNLLNSTLGSYLGDD
ncbi:MAG: hypothetical protein IK044_08235 [Methanobrevibacter sp.]|nr:hypothetical protein [Methanobrevibacter sp.]